MPLDIAAPFQHSPKPVPFRSGEQAWLWTSRMLTARRQGRQAPAHEMIHRVCTPDDILRCLAQLYRNGAIDFIHARVLREWGEKGRAPDRRNGGDRSDYRQWRAALDRLEEVLRRRNIVTGFGFETAETSRVHQKTTIPQKNKSDTRITQLTRKATTGSVVFEANQVGSLITGRAARVSWPCMNKLLPLAVISPPNPDQLRVVPIGATLSFLAHSPTPPAFSNPTFNNPTFNNPTFNNREI